LRKIKKTRIDPSSLAAACAPDTVGASARRAKANEPVPHVRRVGALPTHFVAIADSLRNGLRATIFAIGQGAKNLGGKTCKQS
jgi:hypothetical protein